MKTILFHAYHTDGLVEGLEQALSICRASGATLECVHAAPTVAYSAGGLSGAMFMVDEVIEQMEDHVARIREVVERELDTEDVAWSFRHIDGDTILELARRAAFADLIVSPRYCKDDRDVGVSLVRHGSLLHHTRTPLFIPGDGGAVIDPSGSAIVAWDGSAESANAARGAIDLLKMAKSVRVVRVDRGKTDFPDTDMMEYLSRHGIHAELDIEPFHDTDVVPVLLSLAERYDTEYIVMGGYSRSRLGEWFFGGVTRSLLKASPVGLVMAH